MADTWGRQEARNAGFPSGVVVSGKSLKSEKARGVDDSHGPSPVVEETRKQVRRDVAGVNRWFNHTHFRVAGCYNCVKIP